MAWNVMCWRNLIWNRKSGRGISCSPAPFCKIANSICVNFNILSRIQMCPIRLVVSAHMICSMLSCLWTAADCATWQTSFDPIESSLTLPESFPIHHRENTNSLNKWLISARASASIYSAGGRVLQILESIWLDEKLKCGVMSSKSLIHIGGRERISFECLYLLNANFVIVWSTLAYR